jgi:photosystem II stability/assembly factor-like uncharacterized protein
MRLRWTTLLASTLRAWPLLLLAVCAPPGREAAGPMPAEPRWRALPGAPTIRGKQDDLYFVSARLGWSVNGQGSIFRTDDAGASWTRLVHRPGTYFRAVVFLDSLRGFAGNIGPGYYPGVTDSVALYRTRDGGRSWAPVTGIRGPRPRGICNFHLAPDGRTVWASGRVGGPSFLLVSRDGGESWESRDLTGRLGMLIDVHFVSPERGFLVGGSTADPRTSHTVVLATGDGGATWTEAFRSREALELGWKFAFPTPRTGYVSVLAYDSTSTFLKTEDGGRSWREHPLVPGPYQAKGVGFVDERRGWIAGERPGFPAYRTDDGGRTWVPDTTLAPLVNRIRFVRDRRGRLEAGYAIGATVHRLELPAR